MRIKLEEVNLQRVWSAAKRRVLDIPEVLSWGASDFSAQNKEKIRR